MTKTKNLILSGIVTLIFGLIIYYFLLPPINVSSFDFWIFVFILMIVFSISSFILSIDKKGRLTDMPKIPGYVLMSGFGIFTIIILINLFVSPVFQASSYAKRITVNEETNFTDDIKQVNFDALPLLDKQSSQKLGDRVMGQMPELVSQFTVSNLYTQINYNDKIVRVTPLEYADWIKYFTNHKEGVKGYITVNSVSGEATLTKLDKGMKYMPSALFSEDLYRHIRFKYPTNIFGEEQFEIDNEGNPYWIIPTIKYTGVGMKKEISGIITVDAIPGKTEKYAVKDVPTWIDHVYSADLIIEQIDNWGEYKNGFLNSIFGQKNVVRTTTGYNYTVMNDDVYLYTGVTSVMADQSNLGFVLTNMRTKETKFYAIPGAEEYSAMASAEGQVQQMKYVATFPLLINLNGKPTYLISLKDNAGLVKMYAFVDVQDYQKVVVTDASQGIEKAAQNYLGEAVQNGDEVIEKTITVKSIKEATLEGTTIYYLIDSGGQKYKVSLKVNNDILPFVNSGDTLNVSYNLEKDVIDIIDLSK